MAYDEKGMIYRERDLVACMSKGIVTTEQVKTIQRLFDNYQEVKEIKTSSEQYRDKEDVTPAELKEAYETAISLLFQDLIRKLQEDEYEICMGFDSEITTRIRNALEEASTKFDVNYPDDTKLRLENILSIIKKR